MDVEIGAGHFRASCEANLNKMAMHNLAFINVVVGHDLMHIENQAGETAKGKHHLNFDTRLPHIIAETEKSVINVIDQCLQVAPTRII